MTKQQKAAILYSLFKNSSDRTNMMGSLINQMNITSNEIDLMKNKILDEFDSGIGSLNKNQFDNILRMIEGNSFTEQEIIDKLNFYEIKKEFHDNIMSFLDCFKQANKSINIDKIDLNFKGIQVATFDDFNQIINQGWTGDWVIVPKNVNPKRIQIASMNETGSFTRGYYINADIEKFEPIPYEGKIRYRIYISNPIIINSGNRNIKFSNNPVRYIK